MAAVSPLSSSLITPRSATTGRSRSSSINSSASPFLKGSVNIKIDASERAKGSTGGCRVTCRKKGLHPEFYPEAKVTCNGEHVMTTGGTMKEYNVDVWSGNHPFYLGERTSDLLVNDRMALFRKKYYDGTNDDWFQIPNLTHGEIILPKRRTKPKKK